MKTQSNLDKFIDTLKTLLVTKQYKKSVQIKLNEPEKLAEQMAREIGSDTQRIKFHE